MPTIEEILRAAKEAGASDVHLTVGIPPKMRVNGNLITMDYPRMLPADTLEVLVNIMTEVQRERFEERGEYDMSFSIPNCGRYRVNAYKQRGSVALAFRLVGTVVPSPEELGVPESVVELYQRKRGLVLVTGPTGSGKSTTLAAIIDKINRIKIGPARICHCVDFRFAGRRSIAARLLMGRFLVNKIQGFRHRKMSRLYRALSTSQTPAFQLPDTAAYS